MVGGGERELGRGLLEPGPRVRVELLASGCEVRQNCQVKAGIVGCEEEPGSFACGKRFGRAFFQIVVQRQCATSTLLLQPEVLPRLCQAVLTDGKPRA